MKKLIGLTLIAVLLATGSAEAASLAPEPVQANTYAAASLLSESIAHADGTGGANLYGFGLLGVCGKKKGRPYSCRIDVDVSFIRSDDRGGWIISQGTCMAWVHATRRTAWFPPEWFFCPSEWLPH